LWPRHEVKRQGGQIPVRGLLTNGVSLLQTKLSHREGHETIHVGL
jgi:hypothetical protein